MHISQVDPRCPCPNPGHIEVMVPEPCVVFLLKFITHTYFLSISFVYQSTYITRAEAALPLSLQDPTVSISVLAR